MNNNLENPRNGRGEWIDVSVPVRQGMVHWPNDPDVQVQRIKSIEEGSRSNLSRVSLGSHTGTHLDAPCHFLRDGATLDELPFSTVIGTARVIALDEADTVTEEALRSHRVRQGERVLCKTRNSERCWRTDAFFEDFVHLTAKAARYLAQRRIRLIGVDYLSVGGYQKDGAEVHRILLAAGVWILEGLNLSAVEPGRYDLLCLPLRLAGGDGAPARVVLRRL